MKKITRERALTLLYNAIVVMEQEQGVLNTDDTAKMMRKELGAEQHEIDWFLKETEGEKIDLIK